jgi:uncharacterized protein
MRYILFLSFLFVSNICHSQNHAALLKEQALFERQWLDKYRRLNASPDEQENLKTIRALPFFPFDSLFRVVATLDTARSNYFQLQTTQQRPVWYRTYGYLSFTLAGKSYRMPVYQSKFSVMQGESELFFPFTDLTNGHGTYVGGRYIEMPIPADKTFILDFNKSFNPFCVYSHRYSCELVPEENHVDIEIKAGIKLMDKK